MAVRSSPRSLWPREHGAYIQLLIPLTTALVATTPTLTGGLLALAACLAFVANEPLLVVLGARGQRRKSNDGARARVRLGVLTAGAVIAGGAGLALAPERVWQVAGLAAIPALVVMVCAWRRVVQTVAGESLAALALAGAAAPIAVAGGVDPIAAILIWGAWAIGYATTVIAVHHVIARHRRPAQPGDRARASALVVLLGASIALALREPLALIATPLIALSAVIVIHPPRATRLRAIGVGFLVSSLLAAAYAVTLARVDETGLSSRSSRGSWS